MKKTVILAALLAAAGSAMAQSTSHLRYGTALYPEAQVALVGADGNYGYLSVGGRRLADRTGYQGNTTLGLDFMNVSAGYEHSWNSNWSWGGTLRYATQHTGYTDRSMLVPGLLLRHRAALGPVQFGQRLGVEYAFGDAPNNASPFPTLIVASQTLVRLRLDVEKIIHLSQRPEGFALRPRISFEPALFLRLQKASADADKRTIDFTSLRGELGLQPAPQVSITPWFAFQTNYINSIVQYNAKGEPTSNGKLNALTPVVGLDVRYTLQLSKASPGWQQLPTQN